MIYSMTAFGRSQKETSGYSATVEIRTINSRNLDPVLRLPKSLLEFEDPLRKLVTRHLRRGRVEVYVQIETTNVELKAAIINVDVARFHWEQLLALQTHLPGMDPPRLEHLLSIPHIFESREELTDREAIGALLMDTTVETLEQILSMRLLEGNALRTDCMNHLKSVGQDLDSIAARKERVVEDMKSRLRQRILELLDDKAVDESRFVQEVAIMVDKMDINEEIVRLRSHLDQMESLLFGEEAADGRKLDFLTQEMHRETNTIGSKSGDLETLQTVVRMKSDIAKLKEQIQNIE